MESNTSSINQQKKYIGLIISIIIFLTIIIGLFIISSISSKEGQVNNEQVNVSTHMRDSIQTITRGIFDIELIKNKKTNNIEEKNKQVKIIINNSIFLSAALDAFNTGGDVKLPDETVEIPRATDPEIRENLESIIKQWRKFKPIITNYINEQKKSPNIQNTRLIDTAISSARSIGTQMYNNLDEMAELVHEQTHARAFLLQTIQIIGIGIAIIYFMIFVFFFVRRLRGADKEIMEARKETTEIMQTIHEGLFLIDEQLKIGNQTSDKLSEIIPEQEFSGRQLDNLLENIIDKKNIDNTRRFIRQLFNERIDEQLIEGLNPLQKVPFRLEHEGRFDFRYLHFTFNRVWENETIKHVLVSVTDISDAVEMEERLEKERKQNQQQTELLVKVLQISPPLLASFLRNARHITQQINLTLQRPDRNIHDLKNKAQEIFRDIHGFKGEASALGLDHFVDSCENIEEHLKNLQNSVKITGNDFMSVTITLDELIEQLTSIENLQTNIQNISTHSAKSENPGNDIKQYYRQFAAEVAARNNKSVSLTVKEYDFKDMNNETHDQLKEIIIQLIRNSVVHGIETAKIRKSLNKNPMGNISISLRKEGNNHILKFTDDGAGINYTALREKAKQNKLYINHPEIINKMSDNELNRLIFISGLSTAQRNNEDAGRGMGMDVIKNRLLSLKAKIGLRSKPKIGTQFIIQIPE